MSGNGSLTGIKFTEENVLPVTKVISTEGNTSAYESKTIGGGKRKRLNSARSLKRYGVVNSLRIHGGSKKSRKAHKKRRHRTTKKSWFFW